MLCLYPRENGLSCGQCANCLLNKQLAWRFRLKQEVLCSDIALWLTLQYDDDHLRIDEEGIPYVSKLDCQNYFRQLRKYIKKNELPVNFCYFLVSEYCPTSGRPHYHTLILFHILKSMSFDEKVALRLKLYDLLKNRWYHGFVYEKLFHSGVVRYLTEYVFKPFANVDHKYPTFRLISKGIGEAYLQTLNPEEVINNKFKVPGCNYLPRYYRDKLLPPEREGLKKISDYYWLRRFYNSDIQKDFDEKRFRKLRKFDSEESFIKEQELLRRSQRYMYEQKQKRKKQFKNI